MLILISPAKRQNFEVVPPFDLKYTLPSFLEQTLGLIEILKKKSAADLQKLMSISPALAQLNEARFQAFHEAPSLPALFAFQGDVYQGLSAATLPESALNFAQQHLLVLSGLYGVLKPLDSIQPHRLEMGTLLSNPKGKNLSQYWGDLITDQINRHLAKEAHPVLINLASLEYFKSIQVNRLQYPLIHIEFKEQHQGKYRVIALMAKRARGKMARYIIENSLSEPEAIQSFDADGYQFSVDHSEHNRWVFIR